MHVEYSPSMSVSLLIMKLKGRIFHHLQQEYPELHKKYGVNNFGQLDYGIWSTGHITDEMLQEYLEHHRDNPNTANSDWILTWKIPFSC